MGAPSGGSRLAAACLGSLIAGAVAATAAHAEGPVDPAIEVQLLEPAIGPRTYVTVDDARPSAPGQLSVDVLVTYLTDPFVVYDYDEGAGTSVGRRTAVIEDVVGGQIAAAFGLSPRLQVGAALPLVLRMTGEGLNPGDAMSSGGLTATGLGDLVLEGKLALLRRPAVGLAATAALTVPTSVGTDGGDYLGDDLPGGRLRAIGEWRPAARLAIAANLGLIGRKARVVYGTTVGSQLTYGAAATASLGDRLAAVAELFGRTGVVDRDATQSPLEAIGAVRLQVTPAVSFQIGGGAGLVAAIGSPGLRLFAAASWAPDLRDGDGDRVPNADDRCPAEPEDHDGFEDLDGCPDLDRDGDHRNDDVDRCPGVPEDIDGFDDDDGCPEADNDQDGIGDFDDRCPDHAEDKRPPFDKDGCPAGRRDSDDDGKPDDVDACPEQAEDDDGFEDFDGCPEDNDQDGLADGVDGCPLCPEDLDGHEDGDGCPDFDDDGDGVPDANDKCPKQAETANGVDDFDGCPDAGGRQTAQLEGTRLTISRPLDFGRGDALAAPSDADPIALVMLAHAEVTRWRIVVAARRQGDEAATRARGQRQADAVRARLVKRGVDGERIEAIGAVADAPTVAIVALEEVDPEAAGARDAMCPASLRPVGREPPR